MTVYKPERMASGVTRGAERRDGVRAEARSELRDCTHSEMKKHDVDFRGWIRLTFGRGMLLNLF